MGQFMINGSAIGCPDPIVTYNGRDVLGYQGDLVVYGPYESYTLTWTYISNAEASQLAGRIASLAGRRVAITLPPMSSGTAWQTYYGNLALVSWVRDYASGVSSITVEASRVSTS